jgi:hypothetical protein
MPTSKHRRKPGGKHVRHPGSGRFRRTIRTLEVTATPVEIATRADLNFTEKMILFAIRQAQDAAQQIGLPGAPLELDEVAELTGALAAQMDQGEFPDIIDLMTPYKTAETFLSSLKLEDGPD